MCTVNTFSQTDLKSGILSGISQLTMRPCSRKILITSQIQKENHFIDDLLLSKEDIQQIKNTTYLHSGNSRFYVFFIQLLYDFNMQPFI